MGGEERCRVSVGGDHSGVRARDARHQSKKLHQSRIAGTVRELGVHEEFLSPAKIRKPQDSFTSRRYEAGKRLISSASRDKHCSKERRSPIAAPEFSGGVPEVMIALQERDLSRVRPAAAEASRPIDDYNKVPEAMIALQGHDLREGVTVSTVFECDSKFDNPSGLSTVPVRREAKLA
ncbi:hypothetical protein R1flu_022451 [Riccia fluitans]|uniref:Uncharacterized protein n=1 Tax=Riccia fluitans TaxID=41844 RepID=A0ABD1XP91_9MARC